MENQNKEQNFVLDDVRTFGQAEAKKALVDLAEYINGKASVDQKATANQEWWRLRHWGVLAEQNEGVKEHVSVGSAWLVNSLLNKHADIMDSYPQPNILPREADDENEAKALTSVIPAVLEQTDYEQTYRQMGWDICIDGAAITGVFWDVTKHDGLGDIVTANVDVHNLFWKPGISDIQDSDKVYYVSLQDTDMVKKQYPDIADKIGPDDSGMVTKYIHDDNIDTTNCTEVVEVYYKKTVMQPVYIDGMDEEGNATKIHIHDIPRTILHLSVIICGEVAFSSENDPKQYPNGFYEHGKFPFVIRRLFPIKDSPWGFGYLDIMKNPQKDIDKLDQAVIKNAMAKARPRWWAKKNANISIDEFANWNNEIVEVGSGDLSEAIRMIDVQDVPSGAITHLGNKIEELKETSGNRDFSQGSTQSGVTAASAIAALQEAGSKLSRDMNKELYRGCREEFYMVIELMRQFYAEPRDFRVASDTGGFRFIRFSNANIVEEDVPAGPNGEIRHRKPVFDIEVTAEKKSPFTRAAQNEMIKEMYGMGLFDPNNDVPALTCIEAMDFDGKDKLKEMIAQNGIMMRQYQAAMNIIMQLAQVDPVVAQMAMQQGLTSPEQMATLTTGVQPGKQSLPPDDHGMSAEDRAAANVSKTDNSMAAKARVRAATASMPR